MTDTLYDYASAEKSLRALLEGERDFIATAANFSAFVFNGMEKINWAGFYLLRGAELVLGPFQGRPACVRLKKPKGVCWAAAMSGEPVVVEDVRNFPGHIACDPASVSEIVVPFRVNGAVAGVFDVDSPVAGRFTERDRAGFAALTAAFCEAADFSTLR